MHTLGKYELIEELNSGSMGTVYSALDNVLDRRVAVKTILPGSHLDAELKERFFREARACAKLHHPSIVTIYDFGDEQGTAYIAMELLTGTDLRKVVQERRPLPLEVKLDLGAMILEGLAHAHAAGIVHRDIKPSNIFITEDGRAKILDFGIARTAASSLTMVGRVLGTPNYMAPEQILGKTCDARSDLFSAAIVLYELIAYVHPFQGQSIPKRIVRETADSLRSRFPGAPSGVEAILAKALAKEPGERYQSAEAFAKDLRHAADEIRMAARTVNPVVSKTDLFAPSAKAATSTSINVAVSNEGDGTEVRMSRVLTALQDFDDAMERRDLAAAKRAYAVMKKAAVGDERFEGAVYRSQERLWDFEKSVPAAPTATATAAPAPVEPPAPKPVETAPRQPEPPPPAATPRPSYTPASPTMMFRKELAEQLSHPEPPAKPFIEDDPTIGYSSHPAAHTRPPGPPPVRSGAGGDATSLFGGAPPLPPKAAAPAPPRPAMPTKPTPAVKVTPPKPTAPPAAVSSQKMILGVGGVVVVLILAAGAYFLFTRGKTSAKAEPFVATAIVSASQTDMVSSTAADASTIATAHRGDSLHVLHTPRSATQQWTEVQYMSGAKIYPPGYARTSDLADWASNKPDAALALVHAFSPAPGATESEIQAILGKLDNFVNRFPGTPQAVEANLDIARWNVELARAAAIVGQPSADFIRSAQEHLAKVTGRPDLAQGVQEVTQDLAALIAAQKPGPTTPTPPAEPARPKPVDPDVAMRNGIKAWENGYYRDAAYNFKQVLKVEPGNQKAKDLLAKVQKAIANE